MIVANKELEVQKKTSVVKSKSESVGVAEYPVYDAVTEAVEDMGDEALLKLINAQVRTNSMNTVRAAATGAPSRKTLEIEALSRIPLQEYQEAAGDGQALRLLIDKYVDVLKEEHSEKRSAMAAAAAEIGDDDEDDD